MKKYLKAFLPGGLLCIAASAFSQKTVFSSTGSDQTYIVPQDVYSIHIKLWGAGGGNSGGSAAFVSGYLAVTPGESLTVMVGNSATGIYYPPGPAGRTYGGGGSTYGISDVLAAPGGGRTAIRRGSVDVATAAGGGGGTYVTIGAHNRRGGGYGGIETGGAGEGAGGGTGGTQTGGGSSFGALYQGGDANGPGAGGGGGYYGGGGGSQGNPSQYSLFPGGGGSSLISNLTNVIAEQGRTGSTSAVLPGGATDVDYLAGIGRGAAPGLGQFGGFGRAVISVAPVPEPASLIALSIGAAALWRRRKK